MSVASRWLYAAMLWMLLAPCFAQSDEEARVQAELERIRSVQAELTRERQRDRLAQDQIQAELAEVERDIGALQRTLSDGEQELERLAEQIAEQEQQQEGLRNALGDQQEALATLLRASYAISRNADLRLLLAQDQMRDVSRVLGYQRALQQGRRQQLETLMEQLSELLAVIASLAESRTQLDQVLLRRNQELTEVQNRRSERADVLRTVQSRLTDTQAQINQLARSERELEALLESLQDIFADIPKELDSAPDFSALRGQLAWPSRGRLSARFGTTLDNGRRVDGVIISTATGSEIHAVAGGRVAFSEWLRGFGLLTIVDHGDGYLSLYAHADALLKDVGDWVTGGELIALAGDSGGRDEPAVYFELRHQGKPVDPARWMNQRAPEPL